jgi:hypothetical protein
LSVVVEDVAAVVAVAVVVDTGIGVNKRNILVKIVS